MPIDGFSLFFNDDVINIIIKFTNLQEHSDNEKWKDRDQIEILLYAGICKQCLYDYDDFWDSLFGNTIYRACISKNRFSVLSTYLRFDDRPTRSLRSIKDKFAPIKDLWDLVIKNLKMDYIPGENLTIDE